MAADLEQPIIIKKKKGGHGHGHHGGAWKVAYADFVTALMAFFLLLWLLASTSEEQRAGLADYFSPTTATDSLTSGAGGVLGGLTLTQEGSAADTRSPFGVVVTLPSANDSAEGEQEGAKSEEENEFDASELEEILKRQEEEEYAQTMQAIRQTIASAPELKEYSENLLLDITEEGLRIQIVDQKGRAMFPGGSAEMYGHTKQLLAVVTKAIEDTDNPIIIKGHTDSVPLQGEAGYSNWELSSDRAQATRRAMEEADLNPGRISQVVGKSDTDPFVVDDPESPQNRRISIILKRTHLEKAKDKSAAIDGHAPSLLTLGDKEGD